MSWSLVHHQKFDVYRSDWDRLCREVYADNPLLASPFVACLLRHFADDSIRLALETVDNSVRSMLLLQPRNRLQWQSFMPSQAQLSPTLLDKDADINALFRCLGPLVQTLDLLALDPDYGEIVSQAPDQEMTHALTMSVTLEGDFNNYWSSRSKKLRQNIGRYSRRTRKELGEPVLVVHNDKNDVIEALARYAAIESTGWKEDAGTAIRMDNHQGAFYADLLSTFAKPCNAFAFELYANNKLIASRLAIVSKDIMVMLKTTYDEDFKSYSPGRMLLHHSLEWIFKHEVADTVEFYTNASQDQLQWATASRHICHQSFYRSRLTKNLVALKQHLKRIDDKEKPTSLKATFIDSLEELTDNDWQLFGDTENFFSTREWYRLFIDTVVGADDSIPALVIRDTSDKLLAVWPLWRSPQHQHLFINSVHSLANYYTTFYQPILAPVSDADAVMQCTVAALNTTRDWDLYDLVPMAIDTDCYQSLTKALDQNDQSYRAYANSANWFLETQGCSFADYFESRPKTLRNTWKRKYRALQKGHEVSFIMHTGENDYQQVLEEYQTIYAESWKRNEPYQQFIPGLIHMLADNRWLRLGVLNIDGKACAVQLWFVYHNTAHIFKQAHLPEFNSYSVGTLLSMHMFEYAIDIDKVAKIDYLSGDDEFKANWMEQRRDLRGIQIYNSRTPAGNLVRAYNALSALL